MSRAVHSFGMGGNNRGIHHVVQEILLLRTLISCRTVTLVDRKDPLFPLLTWSQPVDAIFSDVVLDVAQLSADVAEKFKVFCEGLDPLEACNEGQKDETLSVHVFSQEQILAQIVDRKVVFPDPRVKWLRSR